MRENNDSKVFSFVYILRNINYELFARSGAEMCSSFGERKLFGTLLEEIVTEMIHCD